MKNLLELPAIADATHAVSPPDLDAILAGRRPATLGSRVQELAREHLDGQLGIFLLTGMPGLSVEHATEVTLAVSQLLGRLLPQDSQGALVRQVADRGLRLGEGRTGRYSDSRDGGNLHTDGPHHPSPVPDCFALFCVQQAESGGELCIVHAGALLERLPDRVIEVLQQDFHFDRREADADPPTVTRPVLSLGPPMRVCYLREYIQIGHRLPHVPALTDRQLDALDALDALLDDPEGQSRIRLKPGQLIVVNNRCLLHGRTAFTDAPDHGQKRLMLRTWIQRAEPGSRSAV
jgi:alpha-ketoglutarate-dependent taurine dioxygenase